MALTGNPRFNDRVALLYVIYPLLNSIWLHAYRFAIVITSEDSVNGKKQAIRSRGCVKTSSIGPVGMDEYYRGAMARSCSFQ